MALGKPVIFISQDVSALPFDLRVMRTISYDRRTLADSLERRLTEAFRETLGAFALQREESTRPLPKAGVFSIAVTGSMVADRSLCIRRLETLLAPYLGRGVTWYCGSYGDVDEITCDFLVARQEKVVVVGYDAYDISDRMLKFVKEKGLPFVDASREQLPEGFGGPSDRDVLFFTKADVVILLWNRTSHGTRELIDWYRSKGERSRYRVCRWKSLSGIRNATWMSAPLKGFLPISGDPSHSRGRASPPRYGTTLVTTR